MSLRSGTGLWRDRASFLGGGATGGLPAVRIDFVGRAGLLAVALERTSAAAGLCGPTDRRYSSRGLLSPRADPPAPGLSMQFLSRRGCLARSKIPRLLAPRTARSRSYRGAVRVGAVRLCLAEGRCL